MGNGTAAAQTRRTASAPTSIGTIARHLRPENTLATFLDWPPDLFALTAFLLKRTGAYRLAVAAPMHPDHRFPPPGWNATVSREVDGWYAWLGQRGAPLPSGLLASAFEVLDRHTDMPLEDLKGCERGTCAEWEVCRALLTLHALADVACTGFGLPNSHRPDRGVIHHVANQLLVERGSLARIDPLLAIVVPKMRTPQSGMTLRSLSHNVSFHETEVAVRWRTLPWFNRDEHTINVMVVPWPTEVKAGSFTVLACPGHADQFGDFRYFSFAAPSHAKDVGRILDMIREAQKHVRRVHIIVLPEAALRREDLESLKGLLATLPVDQIPLVVSGRCEAGPHEQVRASGHNDVVLSTYFASKWYDLEQGKHHRWKLDPEQVKRYRLAGMLTGGKNLWEGIQLPPRSFGVLAPNGWLALAPLVCEDLAQQEPLAEITRGIGPTVLIAVLQDGPQLEQRWSARYASVLADDPGTSILTVTSLGMARRSGAQPRRNDDPKPDPKAVLPVAMWKDRQTGLHKIDVDKDAVLLSLSATRTEEFTADGRTDYGAAAVVELRNTFPIEVPSVGKKRRRGRARPVHASHTDFEEISTLTYLADSALTVDDRGLALLIGLARQSGPIGHLLPPSRAGRVIKGIAVQLQRTPPGKDMSAALDELARVVTRVPCLSNAGGRDLRTLHAKVIRRLAARNAEALARRVPRGQGPSLRARIAMLVLLLWAIHERVTRQRQLGQLTPDHAQLIVEIEKKLTAPYDKDALDRLVIEPAPSRPAARPRSMRPAGPRIRPARPRTSSPPRRSGRSRSRA
jgi:hypothetical protein